MKCEFLVAWFSKIKTRACLLFLEQDFRSMHCYYYYVVCRATSWHNKFSLSKKITYSKIKNRTTLVINYRHFFTSTARPWSGSHALACTIDPIFLTLYSIWPKTFNLLEQAQSCRVQPYPVALEHVSSSVVLLVFLIRYWIFSGSRVLRK